ncbi:hypothetical protein PG991_010877 [Apiospora marii]|uniref:Uncharacterized protein n=1 Tax=Apiospora marii TaxID=335849 RepID=A0ABR1REN3_9PEZI
MASFQKDSKAESHPEAQPEDTDSDQAWKKVAVQIDSGEETPSMILNDFLSLPRPIIDNTGELPSSKSSQGRGFILVSPEHISIWEDFTQENIDLMFGDFLFKKNYRFAKDTVTGIRTSSRDTTKEGSIIPFKIENESHISDMYRTAILQGVRTSINETSPEFQESVNTSAVRNVDTSQHGKSVQVTGLSDVHPDWPVHFLPDTLDQSSKKLDASGKTLLNRPAGLEKVGIPIPSRRSDGEFAVIGEAKPRDQICDLNTWSRFEEKGKTLWANHISKIILEDSKDAEKFRVVESSRDEFAKQLDKYHEDTSQG